MTIEPKYIVKCENGDGIWYYIGEHKFSQNIFKAKYMRKMQAEYIAKIMDGTTIERK